MRGVTYTPKRYSPTHESEEKAKRCEIKPYVSIAESKPRDMAWRTEPIRSCSPTVPPSVDDAMPACAHTMHHIIPRQATAQNPHIPALFRAKGEERCEWLSSCARTWPGWQQAARQPAHRLI
jgi:hypothetical protein